MATKTDLLAEMIAEHEALVDDLTPPDLIQDREGVPGWFPSLNPTQQAIWEETAKYILAYGERGSGKTLGALHKLVRHCYENWAALAIIIVGVKRQAEEGGAWYKLQSEVLPKWKEGLGIQYTEPKSNTAKDIYIWMTNMHGGCSRILLLSMPVDSFVASRVKGMEPSFILVDEAQTLDSDTYFSSIIQQLGRRPGIALQQIIYCANPAGPSHWLYKRFWELCMGKDGKMDPKYARYHVPISENIHNLPAGYWDNVLEAVKGDPVEYARMIEGKWVDRPTGEAIWKDFFIPEIHVRGDALTGTGLVPRPGYPVQVGYDPGPRNFSVTFLQLLPCQDKLLWQVFDELCLVGMDFPNFRVVPMVLKRMDYWDEKVGAKFGYVHIADDAAFTHLNSQGSYEAAEIQRLAGGRIFLRGCPKGNDSRSARVQMVTSMLILEQLVISQHCAKTQEMLRMLESEKPKDGKHDPEAGLRPRRSPYSHPFDSMTYPMHYYTIGPSRFALHTQQIEPQIYRVGQN